jgi:hypothetical protein
MDGHIARVSVLNKFLTIQILIQKRTHIIIFDNGTKVCYDRIISNPLGEWKYDHHQIMEWYLDAQSNALYHHI